MSGSAGLRFTDAQYQLAAKAYLAAGGSAVPSWWGTIMEQLQGSRTGSAPPPPTTQTVQTQQATTVAAAAQQRWLAGLRTSRPSGPAGSAISSWVMATDADGNNVYIQYVNGQATGKTSFTDPGSTSAPPASSTPTVGDVSAYLSKLITAARGSSGSLSEAELAALAAGTADRTWLAGLSRYRLQQSGSGSGAFYTLGGSRFGGSDTISFGSVMPRGTSTGSSVSEAAGSDVRSIGYFGGDSSANTAITSDEARGIRRSEGAAGSTPVYSTSISAEPKAMGPITTLLDLTNRDLQENDIFPIRSEITWFTRDQDRRVLSFTPVVQETALRGPAAFGQRFSFDLGSIQVGDLLLGTALQIRLDHWLDAQTQNMYAAGKLSYQDRATAWEYANSLGTSIIQLAELEVDGKTLETIDGDFINTFSTIFPDYNTQVGIAYDHLGQISIPSLIDVTRRPTLFPIENGNLNCILPFFFMRSRLNEALPMIAIREGYVKIHITLRPFDQCVRQMRGYREDCTSVPKPVSTPFTFNSCAWKYDPAVYTGSWDIPPQYSFTIDIDGTQYNWSYSSSTRRGTWAIQPPSSFTLSSQYIWNPAVGAGWSPAEPIFNIAYQDPIVPGRFYYWDPAPMAWRSGPFDAGAPSFAFAYGDNVWRSKVGDWSVAAPPFKSTQLLTYGAIVDGSFRTKMLREPFEILHRQVQTFSFDEPLKYSINKQTDLIRVQLPLEANHPIEEIIWFVRRKGTSINNEWTNYSSALEREWNASAKIPMLKNAIIQVNGTVICDAEEQFYRDNIASAHRGGYAAYSRFIYGYSFAKFPGEHQPSGSINASRLNAFRLVLDVLPPGGASDTQWEVKVFCIGMNWLRFDNGLANPMFED
jgi:hypothetical protein